MMIDMRLAGRMLVDPRTPRLARVIVVAALFYVLLPFDVAPDHRPIVGLLDDIVVVGLAAFAALRMIPREVSEQFRPPPPANDNGGAPRGGLVAPVIGALALVLTLNLAGWWVYGLIAG